MQLNRYGMGNKPGDKVKLGVRVIVASLTIGLWPAFSQTPQWIWSGNSNASVGASQAVYFRKTFHTPPLTWNARLAMAADDEAEVFLNSVLVATCRQWSEPARAEVSVRLNQGESVLAVRARNQSAT